MELLDDGRRAHRVHERDPRHTGSGAGHRSRPSGGQPLLHPCHGGLVRIPSAPSPAQSGWSTSCPAPVTWCTCRRTPTGAPAAMPRPSRPTSTPSTPTKPYLPDRGIQLVEWYPAAYYNHNVDFLLTAAEMMGNRETGRSPPRPSSSKVCRASSIRRCPSSNTMRPCASSPSPASANGTRSCKNPSRLPSIYILPAPGTTSAAWPITRQGDLDAAAEELAQLNDLAARPEMAEFGMASFTTAGNILQLESARTGRRVGRAQGDMDQAVAELEAAVATPGQLPLHRAAGLVLPCPPKPGPDPARRRPRRRCRSRLP